MKKEDELSSTGHKLGQLVGDWFQDWFVLPLLQKIASDLQLFLDHRACEHANDVRGGKILWRDEAGNEVDYDFVLELKGTKEKRGIPVAFLECFWRRGARHSKDKARDDSGKLMPMRAAYPTARFLGIVASGEFTGPARELVMSRNIDLLYVPKHLVVEALEKSGLKMDYDDKAPEEVKAKIAIEFEKTLSEKNKKKDAAENLQKLLGKSAMESYVSKVKAALMSAPLEFSIVGQLLSKPVIFKTVDDVSHFLSNPNFNFTNPCKRYLYHVDYSDATSFERELGSIDELRDLHNQLALLVAHMEKIALLP